MKRIKRLMMIAVCTLIAASFLAQYTVTATAPGIGDDIGISNEPLIESLIGNRAVGFPRFVAPSPLSANNPTTSVIHDEKVVEAVKVETDKLEPTSTNTELNSWIENTTLVTTGPTLAGLPLFDGNYCDPNFLGQPMNFTQAIGSTLDDLLNQIHRRFGVNFITGKGVGGLPINVKSDNVPWAIILRSQLSILGVRSTCIDKTTIELIKNDDLASLQKSREAAAPLGTEYLKLKYLQPSSAGTRDIAGNGTGQNAGGCLQGQSSGGGQQNTLAQRCKFERLINEIEKIVNPPIERQTATTPLVSLDAKTAGDSVAYSERLSYPVTRPGSVSQIPGRNILAVTGTGEQLARVKKIISLADVPPFQVVVKALVYTANENKLKDIGVQASVIFGSANLNQLGGVTSQPPVPPITNSPAPGQLNPGGVRTLGPGFLNPLGVADAVFGLSAIVGTAQFSVQATALQQQGVISLKSRPFATVLDGDTTELTVGRQIPVIIQAANNLGGTPGTLQILQAANLLSVTPHVIDDENGNPTAVNLEIQLESNDVDQSVVSQDIPAVSVRSIQSNFILNQEQTAILGGFTVDSDSKTVTKTPGLGDIPVFGELFKRRVRSTQINRLYFAISVTIIPYGGAIEPVRVPGATTDPPSLTPEQLDRSNKAEPKQVVPKKPDN